MQQVAAYRPYSITVTERQGEFLERQRKNAGVPISRTIQMALAKAFPDECKEPDEASGLARNESDAEVLAAAV